MKEITFDQPIASTGKVSFEDLERFARAKVQEFIQGLLEQEITELLGRKKSERRAAMDAPVGYRNGHGKPRRLAMQGGTIKLRRPRVRGLDEKFESRVLPLFEKRTKELGKLLPELYLHGLAQGDFELALRGLLGDGAPLSSSSLERLRSGWQLEYEQWRFRSLADRELVYVWADGIYVKAGLEKDKAALLVVIGAMRDGRKEVLAVVPGHRESKEAWADVLRELKRRGLEAPKLVVADGHLGIWAAIGEVWPTSKEQRCWNHKVINVLDKLPKRLHGEAKKLLLTILYAPTKKEAEKRREAFAARYRGSQSAAVETLERDWDRMVTFYDFPDEHWKHLRTSNVVESPFSSVRLRTDAAKRFKKVPNATALIWKVLTVAEKRFRRLDAAERLIDVYEGRQFVDGKMVKRSGGQEKALKEAAA
jgi:transposase-like protein